MKSLWKRIIKVVLPRQDQFLRRIFVVLKKDGVLAHTDLVINLRPLNQFMRNKHFKMENLGMMRDLLRQGDWIASIDLKDEGSVGRSSKVPPLYMVGHHVRIPMSSFQVGQCFQSLYQASEASAGMIISARNMCNNVPGRHSTDGTIQK